MTACDDVAGVFPSAVLDGNDLARVLDVNAERQIDLVQDERVRQRTSEIMAVTRHTSVATFLRICRKALRAAPRGGTSLGLDHLACHEA